jgi:carbonic anhydrase
MSLRLLRLPVAAFLLLVPGLRLSSSDSHPKAAAVVSPDQALARLLEGNRRFVAEQMAHAHQNAARRRETAQGQHPFAVVLTCADSRVSPEVIFDQGLGDLFVVRNAGNLSGDHVLGSIEYAVEHLHTGLIVVLGHSKCGAVSAAVAGGEAPGHVKSIVTSLEPAVGLARKKPGDTLQNAIRINARLTGAALAGSEPILAHLAKSGKVRVVAALYDLETGRVEVVP